jgi:hypothetical protein
MGRFLRLLELIARFGARIGRRILHLEELVIELQARIRVLMRLAEAERDTERAARLLTRARQAEEAMNDAITRARRLREGLPEAPPIP